LALFVFKGVFAFQAWIAERVAVTIFSRHGTEVWKSMVNEISLEKVKGHFIICGFGQVGRTVVRSVEQAGDSLCPHRNQRGALPWALERWSHGHSGRCETARRPAIRGNWPRARNLHRDRQRCRQFVHHSHGQGAESNVKIITRAKQQGYPNAIRNSGADEVIIPEYEGGLMTGRMIQKYYPVKTNL
jgi:hypothetical protein